MSEIEVSFVMPCLDEAETLAACIEEARRCIVEHGLAAEILVADNGSTDGSQAIAEASGARVVHVAQRGYGAALIAGLAAARGRYLVMGDADRSYDFREAFPMIERLRNGADVVMGSRFRGRIEAGAMPFSHRVLGNPVLTRVGQLLFRSKATDFHCGLRALTKDAFRRMGLRTTGMEFATELIVKATTHGMRIDEVPVTLRPDGRSRPPHLRTWRDGWRHLRFMMVLSPRWTLFLPGLLLLLVAAGILTRISVGPWDVGFATLDIHTMQLASLAAIIGYQAVTTAIAARIFAVAEDIGPPARWMRHAFELFTLERGLLAGLALVISGLAFVAMALRTWAETDFGPLVPAVTMRPVLLGATLIALGAQTLLMSFLYSMLGIPRRREDRDA